MIDPDFQKLSGFAKQMTDENGSIGYLDLGSGKPLVLIHGGHGGWYHWMANIAALAKHRRVIAPDLPGFGASSSPGNGFSLEVVGSRVFELMDALEVARFDLVAFSFGSCICSYMAAVRPERVNTLTLVNPAGMGPVSQRLKDIQAEASAVARARGIEQGVEVSLKQIMLSEHSLITPELTALATQHVKATRVLTRPIARTNPTRKYVEMVKSPIWLVLGSKDPHQAHELAAREKWITGLSPRNRASVQLAAHWLQYERACWFNEHVRQFTSSNTSIVNERS